MDASYYQGKLALITGGSEGIGLSIAESLLQAGARVVIASRNADKQRSALQHLSKFKKESQLLKGIALDVTNRQAVFEHLDALCSQEGVPDILINNAGYSLPGWLEKLSPDDIRKTMETNFFGVLHSTQALLPRFYEKRRGHIVNVSSVAGLLGVFGYTVYCASKYAVIGFSEALRREAAPYGVRVSVLCPPNTRTPGLDQENKIKPPEVLKAEETVKTIGPDVVAHALLKQLPKNPFVIIPTWDSHLIWLAARLFPGLLDILLKRPTPV